MTTPSCTDDDLDRALTYARRINVLDEANDLTLLSRALLRQTAELAAARRAPLPLAADAITAEHEARLDAVISACTEGEPFDPYAEIDRLRAELAAIDRALAGEPVPPDASERARRVARLVSIGRGAVTVGGRPMPAPKDDGLTAEDRAKGWRWDASGPYLMLNDDVEDRRAAVTIHGWNTDYTVNGPKAFGSGPETGAAGQRAAVARLRAAGIL